MKISKLLILLVFLIAIGTVSAAQETLMGFQSWIYNNDGTPFDSGTVLVNVSDSNDCNGDINSTEFVDQTTDQGILDVMLTMNMSYNNDYWLCLFVEGEQVIGPSNFRGLGEIDEEDVSFSIGGGNPFDQSLNTTDKVVFNETNVTETLYVVGASSGIKVNDNRIAFDAGTVWWDDVYLSSASNVLNLFARHDSNKDKWTQMTIQPNWGYILTFGALTEEKKFATDSDGVWLGQPNRPWDILYVNNITNYNDNWCNSTDCHTIADFLSGGEDIYVNETGDTMTGPLNISAYNTGDALSNEFDLLVGEPDFGAMKIGHSQMFVSDLTVGGLDLNGTLVTRMPPAHGTGAIEFAWATSDNLIRFAIPPAGAQLATYNPRSFMIGGDLGQTFDDDIIDCIAQGYEYIDCNTSTTGADLGIQDDLEVRGSVYVNESLNVTGGNITANYYFGDGSQLTGIQTGNPFDQSLNTTDNVTFSSVLINSTTTGRDDYIRQIFDFDVPNADASNTKGSLFNYTIDSDTGLAFPVITGQEWDIEFTNQTAVVFYQPVLDLFKVDIDFNDATPSTTTNIFQVTADKVWDSALSFTFAGEGSANTNGAFYVLAQSTDGLGGVIAARTAAHISAATNSQQATGYQGYVRNDDTGGNGITVALNPIVYGSTGTKYNAALKPTQLSTGNDKNRTYTVYNNGFGHLFMGQGAGIFTSTNYETINSTLGDKLDWSSNNADGSVYIEEDLEVDGIIYADGGIISNSTGHLSCTTTADSTGSSAEYDVFDEDNYGTFTYDNNSAQDGITFTPTDGRFTVDTDGTYMIIINLILEWNTGSGLVSVNVKDGGADFYNHDFYLHGSVDPAPYSLSVIRELSANDYINVNVDGLTANNVIAHDGTTMTMYRLK